MFSIATFPHPPHLPLIPSSAPSQHSNVASRCAFVTNSVDTLHSGSPVNRPYLRQIPVPAPAKVAASKPVMLKVSDLPAKENRRLTLSKDFTAIDMGDVSVQQAQTKDFTAIEMPEIAADRMPNHPAQTLANIRTVFLRNLISVGLPSAARELVRRGLFPYLVAAAPAAVTAAGATIGLFPVVLQAAGLASDIYQGRQTTQSCRARLGNITLAAGAMAGLACSGGLAAAAPALISAICIYVPMRDICQYFLPLSDNATAGVALPAVASAAGAYAVNQTLLNLGVSQLAEVLSPLGPLAADVIAGTSLNIVGETVDHMTWRQLHAYFTDAESLRIACHPRSGDEISWQSVGDLITIPLACRSALFTAVYANTFAIQGGPLLENTTTAATLALAYPMFIYTGEHKPLPAPTESKA